MSEEESKVIAEEVEQEGETGDDSAAIAMPPPPEKPVEIEKMEEQKLKSKFPGNRTHSPALIADLSDDSVSS